MSNLKDEAYYSQLDKRTKEYKEYKAFVAIKEEQINNEVKGVGDVVEIITKVTGIQSAVKVFFGEDCGCGKRQDELNKELPFGVAAVNCINEEDYTYLKSFFSRRRTRIDALNQERLVGIYNFVFDKKMVVPSGCVTCSKTGFLKAVNKLHKYFDAAQTLISKNISDEEE